MDDYYGYSLGISSTEDLLFAFREFVKVTPTWILSTNFFTPKMNTAYSTYLCTSNSTTKDEQFLNILGTLVTNTKSLNTIRLVLVTHDPDGIENNYCFEKISAGLKKEYGKNIDLSKIKAYYSKMEQELTINTTNNLLKYKEFEKKTILNLKSQGIDATDIPNTQAYTGNVFSDNKVTIYLCPSIFKQSTITEFYNVLIHELLHPLAKVGDNQDINYDLGECIRYARYCNLTTLKDSTCYEPFFEHV